MIEVAWFDDERTIVCYRFSKDWLWSDLEKSFHRGKTLYTSVNHTVHIIFDVRGSNVPHPSLTVFGDAMANTKPLNCGVTIIVTDNVLVDMVAKFAYEFWLTQWDFLCAKNIKSALALIETYGEKEYV